MPEMSDTLPEILNTVFFRDHWRTRPVVLRGAASAFLPAPPTRAEVTSLAQATHPIGDGHSIWFLEGLRSGLRGLESLCARAESLFEWGDLWCDVFFTQGSSSVGAHLDNSDNFTVQIDGTKRWSLAPPDAVPEEQRRLRLLGEPGIGSVPSFDPEFQVDLGPGDVLYIPLMWRHLGVSASDSLSVSLVVNAPSVWSAAAPTLTAALRRVPNWSEPLHVGPGSGQARRDQLARILDTVRTVDPNRMTREADLRMHAPTNREPDVDIDRIRGFVASAPPLPTRGFVTPDVSGSTAVALQALLARRTLRNLVKQVAIRSRAAADPIDRLRYQLSLDALLAADDTELERLLTGPDLTSWTAVARQQDKPLPTSRQEDPMAHRLYWIVLPQVARLRRPTLPDAQVPSATSGDLPAPQFHRILSGRRDVGPWTVTPTTDGHITATQAGSAILVERGAPLPRLGVNGPVVLPEPDAWLTEHVPDAVEPPTDDDVRDVRSWFQEALALLGQHLPGAAVELTSVVQRLVPTRSRGLTPYNFSVHAFRGLVVSTPRPPVMAAQVIVHETGHNLMSTLLDLVPLCENPETRVISPVVQQERALPALFHGAYSFARECHLTARFLDAGVAAVPGTDMERYLGERIEVVRDTCNVLQDTARLTPAGEQVLSEITDVLDAITPPRISSRVDG